MTHPTTERTLAAAYSLSSRLSHLWKEKPEGLWIDTKMPELSARALEVTSKLSKE